MIIGIDIDDTLANFSDLNFKYAFEFDKKLRNKGIVNDELIGSRKFDWTDEERDTFRTTYHRVFAPIIEPFEHAKEVIDKLRQEGNKVIIISARQEKYYDDPEGMTITWLEKEGIIVDKLIVGAYPKKEVIIKDEKLDIFIDDVPKICESVSKLGVKTYIYTSEYNKDFVIDGVERINNWKEFYNKINKYKGE